MTLGLLPSSPLDTERKRDMHNNTEMDKKKMEHYNCPTSLKIFSKASTEQVKGRFFTNSLFFSSAVAYCNRKPLTLSHVVTTTY